MELGRNSPCPCGSGKKYKQCCLGKTSNPEKIASDTLFMQAQRSQAEGRLAEAQARYAAILERDPHHPEASHFQGLLYHQTGRTQLALPLIERSLALRPQNKLFLTNAGLIYQAVGDWKKAEAAYRALTKLTPQDDASWQHLGRALMEQGNVNEAEQAYRKATALSGSNPEHWKNLGITLLKLARPGDVEEAVRCFRKAIAAAPDDAEGHNNLGIALGLLNRRDEALAAARTAIKLDPRSWQPWLNLAQIHLTNDEVESALDVYQQGIELAADKDMFNITLGHTLNLMGKFDTAVTFFRRAYEKNPRDLGLLSQFITHQKFTSLDDPLLVKARSAVDASTDDGEEIISLCFALGKIMDKLEQYDAAFAYYHRANRLRTQTLQFDRESHRRLIDSLIQQYDAGTFKQLHALGNPSETPIYIVGMPRSGTTLTEQIIASHPLVAGGGERGFWASIEKERAGKEKLGKDAIDSIAQACLADLAGVKAAGKQTSRVTDKMPHNFLRVGLIHTVFPNARIIHVRRHPVDNCLSIYFQNFKGEHPYAYDLENLAYYRREYERLMQHWREVMPADRYFEFDYEDLVADQEGMSRKLLDFCGLEWDDTCLNYHENERAIKTASVWQVRQKIYTSSVERWRHYAAHIGPLMSLLEASPETA
jgi:Flp pilus assembly protein TadD